VAPRRQALRAEVRAQPRARVPPLQASAVRFLARVSVDPRAQERGAAAPPQRTVLEQGSLLAPPAAMPDALEEPALRALRAAVPCGLVIAPRREPAVAVQLGLAVARPVVLPLQPAC
jgi:hypothetical protein